MQPSRQVRESDSMAARLARQRQERSKRRKSDIHVGESASAPVAAGGFSSTPANSGELQILRTEMAESGATISRLQSQLRAVEGETHAIGQRASAIQAELLQVQAELSASRLDTAARAPPAAAPWPAPAVATVAAGAAAPTAAPPSQLSSSPVERSREGPEAERPRVDAGVSLRINLSSLGDAIVRVSPD